MSTNDELWHTTCKSISLGEKHIIFFPITYLVLYSLSLISLKFTQLTCASFGVLISYREYNYVSPFATTFSQLFMLYIENPFQTNLCLKTIEDKKTEKKKSKRRECL